MPISLSNVAVEQFPDVFIEEYSQIEKKLPPTIMNERGVIGDVYHASVVPPFILSDRGAFQSDVAPIDVNFEDVAGVFRNKVTTVPVDIFQQGEVKANARRQMAKQAAESIARMEDQIIIDQLNTDAKVTKVIQSGGVNLTLDKIREAGNALDIDNIPSKDRYIVAHYTQKKSLLGQTEATSSDYNSVRTLEDGEIASFYGFKFIWFGNNPEGGLELNGDIRTCFAYHRDCAMAAYGVFDGFANPGVHTSFDDRSISWRVTPMLRMGAKVVLGDGIVKILCDES